MSPLQRSPALTADPISNNNLPLLNNISSPSHHRNSTSHIVDASSSPLRNSSPFDSSPVNQSGLSPRAFWHWRESQSPVAHSVPEPISHQESSLSPVRRMSIEKLKMASRVSQSNMFIREQKNEYDPTRFPHIERPLAAGRPLSSQVQSCPRTHAAAPATNPSDSLTRPSLNSRIDSRAKVNFYNSVSSSTNASPVKPLYRPTQSPSPLRPYVVNPPPASPTPVRSRASPTMSDKVSEAESETTANTHGSDASSSSSSPQSVLCRQQKSVTFDTHPPQVNEYETITPDPSSLASGSRRSSYDYPTTEECSNADEYNPQTHTDPDQSINSPPFNDPLPSKSNDPESWPSPSMKHPDNPDPVEQSDSPFYSLPRSDFRMRSLPPLPDSSPLVASSNPDIQSKCDDDFLPDYYDSQMSDDDLLYVDSADTGDVPLPLATRPTTTNPSLEVTDGNLDNGPRQLSIEHSSNSLSPDSSFSVKPRYTCTEKQSSMEPAPLNLLDRKSFHIPKISRESILRKVYSRDYEDFSDPLESPNQWNQSPMSNHEDTIDYRKLDPDVPLPSCEPVEDYEMPHNISYRDRHYPRRSLDNFASSSPGFNEAASGHVNQVCSNMEVPKFLPDDLVSASSKTSETMQPENFSVVGDEEFKTGLSSVLSDGSLKCAEPNCASYTFNSERFASTVTPEPHNDDEEEPHTPESVIHHQIYNSDTSPGAEEIPNVKATVRAPGSNLKTRPSATPADIAEMAEARRVISGDAPLPKPSCIPPLNTSTLSDDIEDVDDSHDQDMSYTMDSFDHSVFESSEKHDILNVPMDGIGKGLGLEQEFDRLMQHTKKGYLMRQNTKIVVASSRQFSNDTVTSTASREKHVLPPDKKADQVAPPRNGQREISFSKPWTTEAWNGHVRRKSHRSSTGIPARRFYGNSNNVHTEAGFESLTELGAVPENTNAPEDGGSERGRLFVKVLTLKKLNLPLPSDERVDFQLTLDNGLHCVTTSWSELKQRASINQEFELVVLNELEFQLTLQVKLTPPTKPANIYRSIVSRKPSPPRTIKSAKSTLSKFSFLSSPKKRKDTERKAAEKLAHELSNQIAASELRKCALSSLASPSTAWSLLHHLVASDGSFARAYVSLKTFEAACFGRPIEVDVPCYNEWTLADSESGADSSVRSKRGAILRKPPYKIGKLTLQMLYVPKPRNARDEDMPKSMGACVRELREAEEISQRSFSGYLSQQGADCPYWRRRYFILAGYQLRAFHETTHQPRATFHLSKAVKVIDDRSTLINPEAGDRKNRRKSAFAEEEEGYMFVEEGFRIKFKNGETIDFYAASREEKNSWMLALSDIIGNSSGVPGPKPWTQIVLAKERAEAQQNSKARLTGLAPAQTLSQSSSRASQSKQQASDDTEVNRQPVQACSSKLGSGRWELHETQSRPQLHTSNSMNSVDKGLNKHKPALSTSTLDTTYQSWSKSSHSEGAAITEISNVARRPRGQSRVVRDPNSRLERRRQKVRSFLF